MRTFFRDYAVFENDDLVRLAYGAQAMCDHDDGAAFHQLSQTFDNEAFGFGIKRRRWLVQDHDRTVANDCARYADALSLAA